MTARQQLEQVRDRLDALLAGGLAHASADEAADIAVSLESLQLSQPANIVKGLAAAATSRSVEGKHFEDVAKIVRMLEQVAGKMIAFETVDVSRLERVGMYRGLFIDAETVRPMLDEPLEKILQVKDRYVGAYLLSRYASRMTLDDLETRMHALWSDARLTPLITERLSTEPKEGMRLAEAALETQSLMVIRTAVSVLEALKTNETMKLLEELVEKADPVVAYDARAALSRLRGQRNEFQRWCDGIVQSRANTVEALAMGAAKEDRSMAAWELRDTRHPAFIRVLRMALKDVASVVRGAAMAALGACGDIALIEEIAEETFLSDALADGASCALGELGDVRGFELLWRLYVAHKRPNLVPEALMDFPFFLGERLAESLGDKKLISRSTTTHFLVHLDPRAFARRFHSLFEADPNPKLAEMAAKLANKSEALCRALLDEWPEQAPKPIEDLRATLSQQPSEKKGVLGWLRGKKS